MCGEDDARPGRDLRDLVDEDSTALAEPVHDVAVVHDLVKRVDRPLLAVEDLVEHVDRTDDAGAEAAGLSQEDGVGHGVPLTIDATAHPCPVRGAVRRSERPELTRRTTVAPHGAPASRT